MHISDCLARYHCIVGGEGGRSDMGEGNEEQAPRPEEERKERGETRVER